MVVVLLFGMLMHAHKARDRDKRRHMLAVIARYQVGLPVSWDDITDTLWLT